jgi:hypothetical protein
MKGNEDMTKSNLWLCLLVICLVLVVASAFGRSVYDQNTKSDRAARIHQYQLEDVQVVKDDDESGFPTASQPAPRRSLGGVAVTAGSPGVPVDYSWEDWQWTYAQHHVEFRGKPAIQFSYIDRQALSTGTSKHGYNVYNPESGGGWPRGAVTGCELQQGEEVGYNPNLDVNSKGRVVMGGHQYTWSSGAPLDNVIWWQPTTAFSCLFGMSVIDSSQYKTGMINYSTQKDSARLYNVMIELQEWGPDTITHLVAQQAGKSVANTLPGKSNCTIVPLQYFRKMTFGTSGSWVGPQTLDTCQRMAHLCASRVSPKVAVIYLQYTAEGIANNNFNDQAVYYRESDSIGTTWNDKVNITPYNRTAGPSYSPWVEARGMYDTNDKLHIVFNASPVLQDPYNNPDQQWGILTTGSSILHWSNTTGAISRIHNAEWDGLGDAYSAGTFCGFVGTNMLTTGAYGISECNGHLYVVWVMGNDMGAYPIIVNDCVTGGIRDARFKANGEIYMSVSDNLDGLLWDKYRNLTNSYTPACDSAGFGGVCMSDVRPTMSRYGMDVTAYGSTLTWPDTGINPGTGTYTGNHWLHMFWVEDHWPDQKTLSGANIANNAIVGTNNPLKWARVACVAPISAPQAAVDVRSIGYPSWTHHGKPDTTVITVTNDGNATLNVTKIGSHKVAPTGPDWLGATDSTGFTVFAGIGNTKTFSLIVNKGGAINTPNSIVAMNGDIYLLTNAAPPNDSISIRIENFLVADTLVNQKWDTVITTCTKLIVSNNGDIGGGTGKSRVNMDYRAIGGECDTTGAADVYLYEGGPIVIRKTDVSSYAYSNQMHQVSFAGEEAFKPFVLGATDGSIAGPGYDGYYTGTFVNKDTTIGVRRTYYAPSASGDTCNMVIVKSVFFGIGGAKANVTLGEDVDWDVPTMTGSNNDGRILGSRGVVYQQGLDTDTSTRCTKHYNRFASTMFLGMYSTAQKTANACANDLGFYGAYVMNNDTLFKYTNDTLTNSAKGTYFWNQMGALSGLSAAPAQGKDQHMVLTYKHNIASLDTEVVYTAQVTVKDGDTGTLKGGIDRAFAWYAKHLRPGCNLTPPACCFVNSNDGRTGNVDCDPGMGVDISDLSTLIDFLYISFAPLCCDKSANIDGDPANGIDISDLSGLIDFLYISFTPTSNCRL